MMSSISLSVRSLASLTPSFVLNFPLKQKTRSPAPSFRVTARDPSGQSDSLLDLDSSVIVPESMGLSPLMM